MRSFKRILLLVGLLVGVGVITYYSSYVQQKKVRHQALEKTIFSFLGAPGCGKGTLAEQCVKELDFKVVSTGNLCRQEIAQGTKKGKMIAEDIRSARLVSDEVVSEMLESWLKQQTGTQPIIFDGYPRTKEQAKILADLLKIKFPHYRFRVISLEVDDLEMIVQRMAGRLVCENKACQSTTHVSLLKDTNKLVCEKCGGKLIRREDDKEEIVRKRIIDFVKNNNKIIAFYREVGIPVEVINVSNSTSQKTLAVFKNMIV